MNKLTNILVVILLVTSISIVPAYARTRITSEIVWSEYSYPLNTMFGDYIEMVTYNEGNIEFLYKEHKLLSISSIADTEILRPTRNPVSTDCYKNAKYETYSDNSVVACKIGGGGCGAFNSVVEFKNYVDVIISKGYSYDVQCGEPPIITPIPPLDTDGGKNYELYGEIRGTTGNVISRDYCTGTSTLIEYYVVGIEIRGEQYLCPNGCSNGRCNPMLVPSPSNNCADGTNNLACSSQKPSYCSYGSLINKASQCGCPSGQIISGDNCVAPTPTSTPPPSGNCADGTNNFACSSQKPLYCSYGSLINKASQCGCPTGQTPSGDICIETLTPIATTQPPTQTTPPTSPCLTGYVYDSSTDTCVKIQTSQGFDSTLAIIAIVGIIITAYIILRKKRKL